MTALTPCCVKGCDRPSGRTIRDGGMCHTHYSQQLRIRGPLGRTSLRERLLSRLVIDPDSDCVLWTGQRVRGYGRISVNSRTAPVHRVMYELFAGPVPEGLTLDHLCRVRNCANVAHLEPVTLAENIRRAQRLRKSKGVRSVGK